MRQNALIICLMLTIQSYFVVEKLFDLPPITRHKASLHTIVSGSYKEVSIQKLTTNPSEKIA
jgi:hypothetical protein